MKAYRRLVVLKTFWGLVKIKSGSWRLGFGCGFLEGGKGSIPGIWLPR